MAYRFPTRQLTLASMDSAADGATERFNEFTDARMATSGGASSIESELIQFSHQIKQMRKIAEDLAEQL